MCVCVNTELLLNPPVVVSACVSHPRSVIVADRMNNSRANGSFHVLTSQVVNGGLDFLLCCVSL